ncbi:Ig-like domain-containing protein [Geoglobus sp.]
MRIIRSINNHAVSPVLGLVLAFAIIVGGIGVVQQFFVPAWIKNDEWVHYQTFRNEFSSIPKLISLSASSGNPNVITLPLRVDRGDYPFLITPPDTATSVTTKEERITIKYREMLPNGSISPVKTLNITTTAIIAKPIYFYLPETEFIYEHGYVFVRSSGSATLVGQNIFNNNSLMLYILKTNLGSVSGGDVLTIPISPISSGGKISVVNATITFESLNPDYWYNTLKDMGLDVTVSGNDSITFNVSNTVMRIAVLGSGSADLRNWYAPYTDISELTMYVGDTKIIEVTVRDRFGNPVPNAIVNASITGDIGTIEPSQTTDASGIARFQFRAMKEGGGAITFESGGNSTSINTIVRSTKEEVWSETSNTTKVTSPGFVWAGIHDASKIILKNGIKIENDEPKIEFILYNSSDQYLIKIEEDRVEIFNSGKIIVDAKLTQQAIQNISSPVGTDILDPDNYVKGMGKPYLDPSEEEALSAIRNMLQTATLSDPVNLAVQKMTGWIVEIQII